MRRPAVHQPDSDLASRVLRLFVSSTFRGMHNEREVLIKDVFPQMRKLCEQRGVVFAEVDFRWGVTETEAQQGATLEICLTEVDHCRPYFIGILGEHYGHITEPPADLLDKRPWLRHYPERSFTEYEIRHGALNEPAVAYRAHLYFRDPRNLEQIPQGRRASLDDDPISREKLRALKEQIRRSGVALREDYPDPRTLGQWVLRDLSAAIEIDFPPDSQPEESARDNAGHDAFARNRTMVYVPRQEYLDKIDDHVSRTSEPLVILGPSGSGKSALLANWATRHRRSHHNDLTFLHFIGANHASADWAMMLRRIMLTLKERFDIEQEIPKERSDLRTAFINLMSQAGLKAVEDDCQIILIIDALNQLEDRDGALDLLWLPEELSASVQIIVSTLNATPHERPLGRLGERGWPALIVEPLTALERGQLIEEYLRHYAKRLSTERVNRIISAPPTGNPLYLRTLINELRVFGAHERLDERIGHYLGAGTVSDLYGRVLERYEEDYDPADHGLVSGAMSLLWASRRGLSETELLDLLGDAKGKLPRARWSPLYLAAEDSLVVRSGLIGFAHDHFRRAVEARYIGSAGRRQSAHKRLAQYFGLRQQSFRTCDELPWQLTAAEDWAALKSLVTRPVSMEALYAHSPTELGYYVGILLEQTGGDLASLYGELLGAPSTHTFRRLSIVHALLLVWGPIHMAEGLAAQLVQLAERGAASRKDLGVALLLAIGSRKMQGEYDYADLQSQADPIIRETGSPEDIAHCLQNWADYHKYHLRDLETALKYHQEEEAVLRDAGKLVSLLTCLNNQGVTFGRLLNPERQIALYLEVQTMARQLGDLDVLALSDSNLGMFHFQAGFIQLESFAQPGVGYEKLNDAGRFLFRFGNVRDNLQKGWALLRGAEAGYRRLRKPRSLAIVLRHQVEALWRLCQSAGAGGSPELAAAIGAIAIPKAEEARSQYLSLVSRRQDQTARLDALVSGMRQWIQPAQALEALGARELLEAFGIVGDAETEARNSVTREFALFVMQSVTD